jgi:hypothetical protein
MSARAGVGDHRDIAERIEEIIASEVASLP